MQHLLRLYHLALLLLRASSHSHHDNPEQDPTPSPPPTRLEELHRKWDFEVCLHLSPYQCMYPSLSMQVKNREKKTESQILMFLILINYVVGLHRHLDLCASEARQVSDGAASAV
jgi:hypothetical protein